MKTTTAICDKCECIILEHASQLEIKGSGDIRLMAEKVDLCGQCGQRFVEFLRTRPGEAVA